MRAAGIRARMADDDPLQDLIEAVADGSLERRRLPQAHRDPTISQLLAELQILAGVSEVHRSQDGGDEPTTDPVVSRSRPEPAAVPDRAYAIKSGPIDIGAPPGKQWGNFELIKKVGEGTFGEVFLARDLWLGHDVALKLLKANITDRARMLQEARMLVRVRHINVVMVHGADVHGGRLGFWMDFIEGSTLHDSIRREGPRSASEAIAWGQDLCRALAAVHNAGIVHRDVKAQNVMRRAHDGRLVLMDFGAGELLGMPRAGPTAGTPLYLAPELMRGAEASRRSDIYALGVLLFYLVSRKFPVQASTWEELMAAHERRERVRLEDLRPDMPSAFVDVVERALRPDPTQRYASAGEMLAAMRGGDDSGPLGVRSSAHLPAPASPQPSPARQTLIRAGIVVLALFALTLVLGYVACTAFEYYLRIDPDFVAGPRDYWDVGRKALLPFLVVWALASAAVAALGGVKFLLRGPLARLQKAIGIPGVESVSPVVLGGSICIAGVVGLVAINLTFYPVFEALEMLRTSAATPATSRLLAPGGSNTVHGELSAILSFLLGFAALKWFPSLELRDPAPPMLRSLKWASLGIAVLTMSFSVFPRRAVWEDFEIVQYEKQRAYVLGSRGNELLLYVPGLTARQLRRVADDANGLERNRGRDVLFAGPS